jgi:hypothetical protein
MYTQTPSNTIQPQPELIEGQGWRVRGIRHGQNFEQTFETERDARWFIRGFVFAISRNLT